MACRYILPSVDDTLLRQEDTYDVRKAVVLVAARWREIGEGLGIVGGKLDNIAAAHSHNPECCMGDVVREWLKLNYDIERFGTPTWRKLVEVVDDPAGGANSSEAMKIARKHLANSPPPSTSQTQPHSSTDSSVPPPSQISPPSRSNWPPVETPPRTFLPPPPREPSNPTTDSRLSGVSFPPSSYRQPKLLLLAEEDSSTEEAVLTNAREAQENVPVLKTETESSEVKHKPSRQASSKAKPATLSPHSTKEGISARKYQPRGETNSSIPTFLQAPPPEPKSLSQCLSKLPPTHTPSEVHYKIEGANVQGKSQVTGRESLLFQTPPASVVHAVAAAPQGYYDILLLGKTGMGKSTTGIKLLRTDTDLMVKSIFPQASEDEIMVESLTSECKLISNKKSMIRVLDAPGFADTKRATKLGLFKANLQTMRWIIRHQQEHELAFHRVLYFLPERGPLEKVDRVLQEEIKVMVHFFGDSIFHRMVIVATLRPRHSKRGDRFDKEDIQQTEMVFSYAMKVVLKEEGINSDVRCPPVVYISLKDTGKEILTKIEKANVEAKTWPILLSDREILDRATATRLAFRDGVCAKCAAKIILEDGQTMVKHEDEPAIPYGESMCHPTIIVPKYSLTKKVLGGLWHIGTLGIPYALMTKPWPGWFNSDEICPACNGLPGVEGCAQMQKVCEVQVNHKKMPIQVNHSNKV